MNQLKILAGQPLDGFTIEERVEIFLVGTDDMRIPGSFRGCLKDESLARAFVEITGDPQCWHPADREFLRTGKVLVLTDGVRAFRIGSAVEAKLLLEDEIRDTLHAEARKKGKSDHSFPSCHVRPDEENYRLVR